MVPLIPAWHQLISGEITKKTRKKRRQKKATREGKPSATLTLDQWIGPSLLATPQPVQSLLTETPKKGKEENPLLSCPSTCAAPVEQHGGDQGSAPAPPHAFAARTESFAKRLHPPRSHIVPADPFLEDLTEADQELGSELALRLAACSQGGRDVQLDCSPVALAAQVCVGESAHLWLALATLYIPGWLPLRLRKVSLKVETRRAPA